MPQRRLLLGACVAVTIVAGCNGAGSQAPIEPSPAIGQNAYLRRNAQPLLSLFGTPNARARRDRDRSWMAPDVPAQDLLYVSDRGAGYVDVYTYPLGKRVGRLTGLTSPAGECVDEGGDIWITDTYSSEIFEYAHGGTRPIAALRDPQQYPVDCSVDPISGNLAVTNTENFSGGQGNVSIYARARGNPRTFSDSKLYYPFFLSYDDTGNLFVDGEQADGSFQFGELREGRRAFATIALKKNIELAGGVVWDGKYIAIGDEKAGKIYRIAGANGDILGTTKLAGSKSLAQFCIPKLGQGSKNPQGAKVVGPDLIGANVMFWNYPGGGTATHEIAGFDAPFGATISKGKR